MGSNSCVPPAYDTFFEADGRIRRPSPTEVRYYIYPQAPYEYCGAPIQRGNP